jgi:hypothetical protein
MDDTTYFRTDQSRERQLWCAVIERAVQDAIRPDGPTGTTSEQRRQREEARRWFVENSHDFRVACDAAGFDPDCVRDRVLRMADATVETTGRPDFGILDRAETQRIAAVP